jgi:hypothetical protein
MTLYLVDFKTGNPVQIPARSLHDAYDQACALRILHGQDTQVRYILNTKTGVIYDVVISILKRDV